MAILPCDYGQHRYAGKAVHLYPALFHGGESTRRSIRACPKHAQPILDELEHRLVSFGDDDQYRPPPFTCIKCDELVENDDAYGFYLTAYPNGSERQDYWGMLHKHCSPPAWTLLK